MPDPFRKAKIIELMELFDDDEVTTADKIDPPEEILTELLWNVIH